MVKTINYNLTKPSDEDFYSIGVHNDNMDIIDGELKNLNNDMNGVKEQMEGLKTNTGLDEHLKASNPHKITADMVGLGSVPNVPTNDQTPTYTEATTLEATTSGEKISVAFGKIKKAITEFIKHLADGTKHVTTNEYGGTVVGNGASYGSGIAIGSGANVVDGVAIGDGTEVGDGIAIGNGSGVAGGSAVGYAATAHDGGAVGKDASAHDGGAIGDGAIADNGFAGGYLAKTVGANDAAIDAVQLGTGTNSNAKTLQVYDYQLMDANGKIPEGRIPSGLAKIKTGTYTGNGAAEQFINLGFTPSAVVVMRTDGANHSEHQASSGWVLYHYYGGLAIKEKKCSVVIDGVEHPIVTIESGGFKVYYESLGGVMGSNTSTEIRSNSSATFIYFTIQ